MGEQRVGVLHGEALRLRASACVRRLGRETDNMRVMLFPGVDPRLRQRASEDLYNAWDDVDDALKAYWAHLGGKASS